MPSDCLGFCLLIPTFGDDRPPCGGLPRHQPCGDGESFGASGSAFAAMPIALMEVGIHSPPDTLISVIRPSNR